MAINQRGDIVGFSDLAGDVSGGVLNANFHAFLWTKESGRMTDLGVLPGDSLSEALDINDERQIVGLSLPSFRAFIYENGKMWNLNGLIPHDSSLFLIAANGINDRGEITGQACVIVDGGCPLGNNIPAFLAIPKRYEEVEGDSGSAALNIAVPEGVRQWVMRRVAFGHLGPERVGPP
jgi:probable HAF family extracellular repeat protein